MSASACNSGKSNFSSCDTSLTLSQTSPGFYVFKSFENTVGKGEIAHNEQFLLFPVFSTRLENFLSFSSNLICRRQTLSVWKSLKYVVWERVKPE